MAYMTSSVNPNSQLYFHEADFICKFGKLQPQKYRKYDIVTDMAISVVKCCPKIADINIL